MPTHLEEAARILRVSPISTLDEFGRIDRYIQNIRLDVTAGTSLLMSKHKYVRMYISTIHPILRMMIDQQLAVLFPNQNPAEPIPVEEVRKAATHWRATGFHMSTLHQPSRHTQVSSSKLQHPSSNTLSHQQ